VRVLSLDTTTRAGSAALVEDDRIVEVRSGDASRSHAERLPGDLLSLLVAHGLAFGDIDVFAVAAGPGSFTGLRIGIATIQGLAFTCGRRVVAVSALEALAQSASVKEPGADVDEPGTWNLAPGTLVVSWMDAHRHEVFGEVFRVAGGPPFEAEHLESVEAIRVGPPAALLEDLRAASSAVAPIFAGDGATLYSADISRAFPAAPIAAASPLAGAIGLMAAASARRGRTIDPAAIQPLYVRRPDAVLAREAAR
jgi:tRNA threonylcarbamoyladenosine biosynthesis protein TsaB